MGLKLVVGNKNYSSWSMRPWFAMKAAGIPFEEVVIPMFEPGSSEEILSYSPTGKVPVLLDGDLTVWDSLAILEYLAEKYPAAKLWPEDTHARAHARSISAEMHSGFAPLRAHCGMVVRREPKARALPDDVKANVIRIQSIWADCRVRYGWRGPFLFGDFTAADAMFAPVVSRFETYMIPVDDVSRAYMAAIMSLPAWRQWKEEATAEPWVIRKYEDG